MNDKPIIVANDNRPNKAGHIVGRRTYYTLTVIERLLREHDRGLQTLPDHLLCRLRQDKHDIDNSTQKDGEG